MAGQGGDAGIRDADGARAGPRSDPAGRGHRRQQAGRARTDVFWLGPHRLDLALDRVRAYAGAGADGVFVPGVPDERAIRALAGAVAVPLNVLVAPGRPSLPRLAELGVRRASCGSLPFRVALGAAVDLVTAVAAGGPVPGADAPGYAAVQALADPPDPSR